LCRKRKHVLTRRGVTEEWEVWSKGGEGGFNLPETHRRQGYGAGKKKRKNQLGKGKT